MNNSAITAISATRSWAHMVLSTLVLLALAKSADAQQYTVTDLGTLPGGTSSEGYGINASGQVTGDSCVYGGAATTATATDVPFSTAAAA